MNARALVEAEREEARELLAQMRPEQIRRRLRERPPADAPGDEDADAATLHERLEVEKAEARKLLGKMRPHEIADRAAPPEPNPLVLVLACLALGILLAKLLDWRGHAHPSL